MLPKINRADKKSVEMVFKEGQYVNSPNFSLKFSKKGRNLLPQVSFVVPKTASKNAVVRNLIRRRGYDAMKDFISTLPRGFVGVFVFGKKSNEIFGRLVKRDQSLLGIKNEIKNILSKIY